jgi:hypothetical protein
MFEKAKLHTDVKVGKPASFQTVYTVAVTIPQRMDRYGLLLDVLVV